MHGLSAIGFCKPLPVGSSGARRDRSHIPAEQPFLQTSRHPPPPAPPPSGSMYPQSMGQWMGPGPPVAARSPGLGPSEIASSCGLTAERPQPTCVLSRLASHWLPGLVLSSGAPSIHLPQPGLQPHTSVCMGPGWNGPQGWEPRQDSKSCPCGQASSPESPPGSELSKAANYAQKQTHRLHRIDCSKA